MSEITINMSYSGEKIEGQGVGAATKEQIKLIKSASDSGLKVLINENVATDILHVHTVDPKSFFRLRRAKGKTVMHVHFLPETLEGSIDLPKFAMNIFYKYFLSMYRIADELVVVNPIFIDALESYGVDRRKINYIPNFVSREEFHPYDLNEQMEAKRAYGIPEDAFTVLGVGQVQTRKGVLDFIEVAKAMPHINFLWAGGFSFGAITDGYKELKEATDNPPSNVKFLGIVPRTEMNRIYNACDLLFMPSYNELFPMAILEACSSGLPILLRNLELYEDILFEKYISGENVDEFISYIEELSHRDEKYESAIDDSKYISQYYSPENLKEIWIDFYKNIVKF